jgi:hypothetical protein
VNIIQIKRSRGLTFENIALKYKISVEDVVKVLGENSKQWDGVNT